MPLPIVPPNSLCLAAARFQLPSKALKHVCLLLLPKASVCPLQGSGYLPKHLSAFTYYDSQKLPFGPCKVPVTFPSIKVPLPIVTLKSFCLVSARFWLPTKALKHLSLLCLLNSKMQSKNFHLAAARFQLPSKALKPLCLL